MKKTARRRNPLRRFPLATFLAVALSAAALFTIVYASYRLSTTDSRSQAQSLNDSFVTRQGTQFYLDNKEFRFIGFNLFDAAGAGESPYSCLQTNGWWTKFSDSELDAALKTMKQETGSTVLRFWAFQKYTNNGTDFSGIDKVIRVAKQNGFKVMPVLEDGPGYCTEPGGGGNNPLAKWKYQNDTWYTEGYKVPNAPYKLSYRDYVKTIVTRYKDEPTIMAWMLVNEADTSKRVTNAQGKQESALVAFSMDMAALVKSIDRNHLLTVGTQSNGASGATGQDFIDVYGLENIDFAEAHDWGYWGNDAESIPGGVRNSDGTMSLPDPLSPDCLKTYQAKIGCSMAQAVKVIKKPMVMGEVGIAANTDATRQRRAQLMDDKMKAFFENEGAGYLYWQWNKIVDSQQYDVLATTNDPLLPVMRKYAGLAIYPRGPVEAQRPSPLPSPVIIPSPVPSPLPSPVAPTVPTPRPSPLAIPSPRPSPIATFVPRPSPRPSPQPQRPSPRPSSAPTPVPQPAGKTVEGENLSITAKAGSSVEDAEAYNSRALFMSKNTTATGTIQGPIRTLVIRAKPQKCLGNPHLNVKINGSYVLDVNIDKSGYSDYTSNDLSYLRLGNAPYTVEVIYNNDASFGFCDRNVLIDQITVR